jgi:hypothetical protein
VTDLDGLAFDALFDSFRATAARLETRPAYAVGGAEGERLDAWRRGLPRPERSVRTDPWLARIATSTISGGRSWRRVRVFDNPLTDYQRYQIESYREAQAVGDQVVIASRAAVGESVGDVWVFDQGHHDARAVVMHYGRDGGVERRELVTDPASVAGLVGQVERVAAKALPLNRWLAASGGLRIG